MSGASSALLPRGKRYFPNRFSEVLQCVVVDINMRSWTVDVASKLLGRYWADVQAGSQYLHQYAGEGIYCMPEVGATCMLCLPTDMSGPFIMSYISPGQTTVAGQSKDAREQGTTGKEYNDYSDRPPNKDVDYTYASNRPIAKPGDIVLRGRDGNRMILHRGGVLEIGAGELAQRIYVPLSNLITDVSERYEHHNVAGAIRWGMQPLDYQDRETWWRQTFRVFADDKYCDVRVTCGNDRDIVKLPDGEKDDPTEKPICYEVALIPSGDSSGFKGVDGEVVGQSHNQVKMLYRFDRKGNCLMRADGNTTLLVQKKLFVKVKGDFTLQANSINMTTTGDATLGADGVTNVKGSLVKLAGGGVGVARQMDMVMIPGSEVLKILMAMLAPNPTPSAAGSLVFSPGAAAAAAAMSLQGAITTSSTKTETA